MWREVTISKKQNENFNCLVTAWEWFNYDAGTNPGKDVTRWSKERWWFKHLGYVYGQETGKNQSGR